MKSWRRDVGWGWVDQPSEHVGGTVFVAALGEGEIRRIDGPASIVARAAADGLDLVQIRKRVAEELQVAVDDVDEGVVHEVIDELVDLGVLRPVV